MKKLTLFVTIICLALGTTIAFAQEDGIKTCGEVYRKAIVDCKSSFNDSKDDCIKTAIDDIDEINEDDSLTKKEAREMIRDVIKQKNNCIKDFRVIKKTCFTTARTDKKDCLSGNNLNGNKTCGEVYRKAIVDCKSSFNDSKDDCIKTAIDDIDEINEDDSLTKKEAREMIRDVIKQKNNCIKDFRVIKKTCFTTARTDKKDCLSVE